VRANARLYAAGSYWQQPQTRRPSMELLLGFTVACNGCWPLLLRSPVGHWRPSGWPPLPCQLSPMPQQKHGSKALVLPLCLQPLWVGCLTPTPGCTGTARCGFKHASASACPAQEAGAAAFFASLRGTSLAPPRAEDLLGLLHPLHRLGNLIASAGQAAVISLPTRGCRYPTTLEEPGMLLLRIDAPVYFANVQASRCLLGPHVAAQACLLYSLTLLLSITVPSRHSLPWLPLPGQVKCSTLHGIVLQLLQESGLLSHGLSSHCAPAAVWQKSHRLCHTGHRLLTQHAPCFPLPRTAAGERGHSQGGEESAAAARYPFRDP
jgi:hypothetical protein